ncbi:MAG: class I adenylate-forming enzyme family protein [Halanaerobium sp.]|nr:class I adenylate-forming enzyme family protein [Halanaerobium sp.]
MKDLTKSVSPRWEHPLLLNPLPRTTADFIEAMGNRLPRFTAARDSQKEYSYGELDQLSRRVSGGLSETGIKPGDVIVIDLPVGVDLLLVFLAVTRMSAVALPLNDLLQADKVQYILEHTSPAAAIGDYAHQLSLPTFSLEDLITNRRCNPALHPPREDTTAMIRMTSGTMGKPKLIPITHKQAMYRLPYEQTHFKPGARYGCVTPHNFPNYQIMTALGVGGTVIFHHEIHTHALERFIAAERITHFWGVPAAFALIADSTGECQEDLSCLEAIISSGSYLDPEIKLAVEERWQTPVYNCYGQSELGYLTESDQDTPAGSVGKVISGVEVQIVARENGEPLPPGETGQVLVKTEVPFPGYLTGEPSPVDEDGWYITGDLGYLDQDSHLFLTGREKEFIHVSGFKVSPREVEKIIRSHPQIEEVYAFGEKERIRGEVVAVAVVKKDGASHLSELKVKNFARNQLSGAKRPRQVYFVSHLPKNRLGKVDRQKLFAMIARKKD